MHVCARVESTRNPYFCDILYVYHITHVDMLSTKVKWKQSNQISSAISDHHPLTAHSSYR